MLRIGGLLSQTIKGLLQSINEGKLYDTWMTFF